MIRVSDYLGRDRSVSLRHYGMKRRSGRYKWGSGEDPYQHENWSYSKAMAKLHENNFLGRVEKYKKDHPNWTETPENIKEAFGLSTTQYRAQKALAKDEEYMYKVSSIRYFQDNGITKTSDIAKKMNTNESSIRTIIANMDKTKANAARDSADIIKAHVDEAIKNGKSGVDVGVGVARELGISEEKMNQALALLEAEGYHIYKGRVEQATNAGSYTTIKAICGPDKKYRDIYDFSKIDHITDYTTVKSDLITGKDKEYKLEAPASLDSKRVQILTRNDISDGGYESVERDGMIEIRRGVKDLSLGDSNYSQVRILVDGDKYLKGMAVYSDAKDWPEGIDVRFNSNKSSVAKGYKEAKRNADGTVNEMDPFGALIKAKGQYHYIGDDGKEHLSPINKTREEGDWDEWKNGVPAQFLSKQEYNTAKKQLNIAKFDKQAEFDDIMALENPVLKKHLLQKFSDECDSSAKHLTAASFPGQKYHVILSIPSLKDNEVYAPGYENGTKLALVRYPHGGVFEIPILTVNNKNAEGNNVIGNKSIDAVGINSHNAGILSGADFDGDTVMCIPTHDDYGNVQIKSKKPLEGLKDFDPQMSYPERPGMKYMTEKQKQKEMGVVSNLITDMTLAGANDDELARAVRHSMVVIDAYKHKLDYKQSEIDNDIQGLKAKYQKKIDPKTGEIKYGGASTVISRAKGTAYVDKRKGSPKVNMKGTDWYDPTKPEGAYIYTKDPEQYSTYFKINKATGERVEVKKKKQTESTQMDEAVDAYSLLSANPSRMELLYADYANSMKALANKARKTMMETENMQQNPEAKKLYSEEVKSLKDKLLKAQLNKPRERAAQLKVAGDIQKYRKEAEAAGIKLENKDIKKQKQRYLSAARAEMNSIARRDRNIDITPREWEAIQAGAISSSTLSQILNNTDIDTIREYATPKTNTRSISPTQKNLITAMSAGNYSISDIAKKLGVSTSTVAKYMKGDN